MTDWHREAELNAQRIIELEAEKDALIKNYAECMKEYAKAIFKDIDRVTKKYLDDNKYSLGEMIYDLEQLREKYTEGKI